MRRFLWRFGAIAKGELDDESTWGCLSLALLKGLTGSCLFKDRSASLLYEAAGW